ncbi:MAG TPA: terminase family protein [Allosphingosinicella sp.]|jgi:phage terminase large subunit-like protein
MNRPLIALRGPHRPLIALRGPNWPLIARRGPQRPLIALRGSNRLPLALPAPDLTVYTKSRFGPGAPPLSRAEKLEMLERLVLMTPGERRFVLLGMPAPAVRALAEEWWWQAHGGQIEPKAAADGRPWRVWTIMAGRGFGKTRAGSEWVWARARENPAARIALVGATIDEVERVMVEGESGILNTARGDEAPRWMPSKRLLLFPSGAEAHAFSAERPDKLRGPQHHHAWCDELAKWPNADATWNNLMLGLRLGERPRTIVSTTPKPVPILRRIIGLPRSVTTHGRSEDNPALPADHRTAMREMLKGTRLERQELDGLLLEEFEGALWSRELLDEFRDPPAGEGERFERVVLGLDPPASSGGDSCGIVICSRDGDGICRVIADLSAPGLSPERWARRVCEGARLYRVGRVVAEKNQGGEMIASNLRAVDADLPVRLVHAGPSKAARAEPIALRFETGRARLAGRFPELEDQLCALTWQGYEGAGSPDRADAMVWAMTELFRKARAEPRIRVL